MEPTKDEIIRKLRAYQPYMSSNYGLTRRLEINAIKLAVGHLPMRKKKLRITRISANRFARIRVIRSFFSYFADR